MSETNHNQASFDSQSVLSPQNDSSDCDRLQDPPQNRVRETVENTIKKDSLSAKQVSPSAASEASDYAPRTSKADRQPQASSESLTQKMDWQKVAHKLREYNRKLLKKVFRLEQELAEVDNKYNKYVEKSQNSDLLLAHQAEEIKQYQEKVNLLTQKLDDSQQQIDGQKSVLQQVGQQYELSQKQTAQLERECTLLQEKYNHTAFELVKKEQETQELQLELNQQERTVLQQNAELKRYQEAAASRAEKASRSSYPHNRYIKPWSTTIPEKITLPRNKTQPAKAKIDSSKTAAEIATWSATATSGKQTDKSSTKKSSPGKKPQTLAAVDLPTFPRT